MPAEQALKSPLGNGPGDLQSPVPQAAPTLGPQASPASEAPSQPAQPQPRAPAPAAAPPHDDFDDFMKKKSAGRPTESLDPFALKDPNLPLGYTPITSRLRKDPQGALEHLTGDGKWQPIGHGGDEVAGAMMNALSQFAVRTKEDIPRVVGAVLGAGIADKFGMGPWASAFLAGGGQALGGAAASAMQGKPVTAGQVATDIGVGAGADLVTSGVGSFLGGMAKNAEKEAMMAPLIKQGGEALQERHAQEMAAAQAIGAKTGPSQTAQELAAVRTLGPESQKLYQMQWGKAQQFRESLHNAASKLQGGFSSDLGGDSHDFHSMIGQVVKNLGESTTAGKSLAKEVSGGAVYDIDPVLSQTRDEIQKMLPKGASIFDESGRINARLLSDAKDKYPTLFTGGARELANVYQELFTLSRTGRGTAETGAFAGSSAADAEVRQVGSVNFFGANEKLAESQPKTAGLNEFLGANEGPRKTPGLTMDEMDTYRRAFGDRASFQSLSRDATNDAYARMHHVMSDHMDGKMIEALNAAGKDQEANQLMAAKQAYSSIKETAQDLQKKVEQDPENAARALIDNKKPEQTRMLWSMMTKKQQDYLQGGLLNTLLDPTVDSASGKMKAATAASSWARLDGTTKATVFGDDGTKYIDSMINYAKAINLKAPGSYNPQGDSLMSNFVGLAHTGHIQGAAKFISGLFQKNATARDYVTDKLSGVMIPAGEGAASMAQRQQWLEKASRAMSSRWAGYGAATVGADIESPHEGAH